MTIYKQGPYHVLSWDWKAQPNEVIDDFIKVLENEFSIDCHHIKDTGGDDFAVVLGETLSADQAESVYRIWANF